MDFKCSCASSRSTFVTAGALYYTMVCACPKVSKKWFLILDDCRYIYIYIYIYINMHVYSTCMDKTC